MSLSGVVDLPGEQGKKLRIEFTNNGRELYWLHDELIQDITATGAGKSHNRKVPIEGYDIELRYLFSGKQSFADLYIDGVLYEKDVFSMKRIMKGAETNARAPSKTLLVVIGVLILLLLVLIFATNRV